MRRLLIWLVCLGLVVSLINTAIKENWLGQLTEMMWDGIRASWYDCDHSVPSKYNEDTNQVTCECKKKRDFNNLSYAEFVDILTSGQKYSLLRKECWGYSESQYNAQVYLRYRGIEPAYFELINKLPKELVKDKDAETLLNQVESCFSMLGKLTVFEEPYTTYLEGQEKKYVEFVDLYALSTDMKNKIDFNTGTKWVCAKTLSQSIGIANDAIVAYKFLDATEDSKDIGKACDAFIEAISATTDHCPAPISIYFTVMLDTLDYTLDVFFKAYENYEFNWDTVEAAIVNGDDFFARTDGDWHEFGDRGSWDKLLEDVEGLEGVYGLPSVEEALSVYPEASQKGKELLSVYIVYRLDKVFREKLDMSYAEFVKCLEA